MFCDSPLCFCNMCLLDHSKFGSSVVLPHFPQYFPSLSLSLFAQFHFRGYLYLLLSQTLYGKNWRLFSLIYTGHPEFHYFLDILSLLWRTTFTAIVHFLHNIKVNANWMWFLHRFFVLSTSLVFCTY